MRSIQIVCDALISLNGRSTHATVITFSKWIKRFEEDLKGTNANSGISTLTIKKHDINS